MTTNYLVSVKGIISVNFLTKNQHRWNVYLKDKIVDTVKIKKIKLTSFNNSLKVSKFLFAMIITFTENVKELITNKYVNLTIPKNLKWFVYLKKKDNLVKFVNKKIMIHLLSVMNIN
jgi:hypothetical protein